jgi:hypothetical protein
MDDLNGPFVVKLMHIDLRLQALCHMQGFRDGLATARMCGGV